ncbi:rab11 family-interacting protein 2 isoform X2 [Bombina bombina]|uniref:rab11 family-interacting protein 2 isoform X2 n=1 Tax=Bombina bombina TaxID=8345 RepID=UPI00235A83E9|nr:rab11 family-interacting protein 2 isoform X2 [Bombina bombina]
MLEDFGQKWLPTDVQVTVLEARDLHPKGKHGTNDTYTIIQLGKEKYSTSVVEKSLNPVWKEEASFELPGLLVQDNTEQYQLQLTVMHRSLVGLDKFLGQVCINLNEIFEKKERRKIEWFKLESKQGKWNKERGELKLNVQFVRNNMTASMFDLSMKDKTRSPFARLKDKMKGRKTDGSDTSSAIVTSTSTLHSGRETTETQIKNKPKKPFLLGPQRLSSAHSMSDLSGPQSSRLGTLGLSAKQPLDSISSAEESGSLKSPHRRTMSADTSKTSPLEPDSSARDWASGGGVDSASDTIPGLPQKFATLPRQWTPYEDSNQSLDSSSTSTGLFSKSGEARKDGKKKDKVSLFERVTGKKEGKRSEKASQNSFEGGLEVKTPDSITQPHVTDYEPTNPFAANFRMRSHGAERSRTHLMEQVSTVTLLAMRSNVNC